VVRTIARVEGGRLYPSQAESTSIIVGTPAWFDWLEQHRAFLFVDSLGAFTASKRESQSWEAARTRHGKRARVPLGQSNALTLQRLQAAAKALAVASATDGPTEEDPAAAMVGSPGSLLHTKIYRPRVGSDVLPRARLV
jgi:LuxR family maltose regulon positive regulatory protein